ncbi:MAG TPA: hypothetical protein VLN59_00485 [Burkholderiales bacterium]|nr:hypothetical protein [Burkholderiales bacterium]
MRRHCIISLARSGEAKKWMWHTELEPGSPLMQSPEEFLSFEECVNDARRHGHYHVEVPVLKDDYGASRVAGAPQTGLSAAGRDETES